MSDTMGRLRAIVAHWPDVAESTSYGTPSFKVRGKFMARLRDPDTLVVRCPIEEKEMLMAAEPDIYFETDHYRGYDAVLVRLAAADDARLLARLATARSMQLSPPKRSARKPR